MYALRVFVRFATKMPTSILEHSFTLFSQISFLVLIKKNKRSRRVRVCILHNLFCRGERGAFL